MEPFNTIALETLARFITEPIVNEASNSSRPFLGKWQLVNSELTQDGGLELTLIAGDCQLKVSFPWSEWGKEPDPGAITGNRDVDVASYFSTLIQETLMPLAEPPSDGLLVIHAGQNELDKNETTERFQSFEIDESQDPGL